MPNGQGPAESHIVAVNLRAPHLDSVIPENTLKTNIRYLDFAASSLPITPAYPTHSPKPADHKLVDSSVTLTATGVTLQFYSGIRI